MLMLVSLSAVAAHKDRSTRPSLGPICRCLLQPAPWEDESPEPSCPSGAPRVGPCSKLEMEQKGRERVHAAWRATVARRWAGAAVGSMDVKDMLQLPRLLRQMQQHLRVYLHPVLAGTTGPNLTWQAQRGYALERYFFARMSNSSLRERDRRRASLFYLPYSPAAVVDTTPNVSFGEKLQRGCDQGKLWSAHLNASGADAARTFWVSGRDAGRVMPSASAGGVLARSGAITINPDPTDHRLLCDLVPGAALSEEEFIRRSLEKQARRREASKHAFRPSRDVAAAPGVAPAWHWERAWDLGRTEPANRSVFVLFAGTLKGYAATSMRRANTSSTRGEMARMAPAFHRTAVLSGRDAKVGGRLGSHYEAGLASSVFCLMPRGHGVWSPRLVDAIMYGCIPAIIGDSYWLPLSCLLDWRDFSIFLPEAEPDRWPHLLAVALRRARPMHAALMRVRRHFVWANPDPRHEGGLGWGPAGPTDTVRLDEANATDDHFSMLLLEMCARASSPLHPHLSAPTPPTPSAQVPPPPSVRSIIQRQAHRNDERQHARRSKTAPPKSAEGAVPADLARGRPPGNALGRSLQVHSLQPADTGAQVVSPRKAPPRNAGAAVTRCC